MERFDVDRSAAVRASASTVMEAPRRTGSMSMSSHSHGFHIRSPFRHAWPDGKSALLAKCSAWPTLASKSPVSLRAQYLRSGMPTRSRMSCFTCWRVTRYS